MSRSFLNSGTLIVTGITRKQQRTLRSTALSTNLIGIVGAGDQTEESCQRVRRWIRDFPHLEQIHKTTYAPMIYRIRHCA
jgi:hypothetical protein